MAITQIGVKPEEPKENAWDKISKVMGFASSAMSIATDANKLFGSPKPVEDPTNSLARRFAGSSYGPKRTGVTY